MQVGERLQVIERDLFERSLARRSSVVNNGGNRKTLRHIHGCLARGLSVAEVHLHVVESRRGHFGRGAVHRDHLIVRRQQSFADGRAYTRATPRHQRPFVSQLTLPTGSSPARAPTPWGSRANAPTTPWPHRPGR